MVDSYCRGCKYLGTLSRQPCCLYMDITGHSRGCPPGTGCTQRTFGPRIQPSKPFSLFKMKTKKEEAEKPKPPPKKELSQSEFCEKERNRKKLAAERYRAIAQGRQKQVIQDYKKKNNISAKKMGEMVGVSESTINKWTTEYTPANWEKLAELGIAKPDF